MIDSATLGQALLREGLLNEAQLKHAFDFQRTTGGDLRDILPKLGYVRESVMVQYIAKDQHMHFVDPETSEVDEELMAKIPRDLIEKHVIVPLKGEGNRILLAISDPDDFAAIDEVQFLTNRSIESALATRSSIRKAVNQYYARASARRKGEAELVAATAAAEKAAAAAPAGPAAGRARPDGTRRLLAVPGDVLLRALVLTLIEKGEIEAEKLLGHVAEVESAAPARGS